MRVFCSVITPSTALTALLNPDSLKEAELETELRPLLARFATERTTSERFGDWCDRVVLKNHSTSN